MAEDEKNFSLSNTTNKLDTVFGSSTPLIDLGTEGNVVLPKCVTLADCKSELDFLDSSEQTDGKIANIAYYYADKNVGGTSLVLNSNDNSFEFGPKKNTKSNTSKPKKGSININIWILLTIIIIIAVIILVIRYTRVIQNFNRKRRRRNRRRRRQKRSGIR